MPQDEQPLDALLQPATPLMVRAAMNRPRMSLRILDPSLVGFPSTAPSLGACPSYRRSAVPRCPRRAKPDEVCRDRVQVVRAGPVVCVVQRVRCGFGRAEMTRTGRQRVRRLGRFIRPLPDSLAADRSLGAGSGPHRASSRSGPGDSSPLFRSRTKEVNARSVPKIDLRPEWSDTAPVRRCDPVNRKKPEPAGEF